MRKLNKIIKKHTQNKQRRLKKNIEVIDYLDYILSVLSKNYNCEQQILFFTRLKEFVFLEKYFDSEMIENKIDVVNYLFDYFDFDLFEVNINFINMIYSELNHPDNPVRNRLKLSLRVPEILNILNEYR